MLLCNHIKQHFNCPGTPFYKRGCQDKTLPPTPELSEDLVLASSPRDQERFRVFPSLKIHSCWCETPSVSDAIKQHGGDVPTMVLSETRGL